ncbi:EAL domain-containing protein [Hoeflea sp.]|uniref:bifunctional diguanylate cyclase/phosphodiesterase n=1 Tax=Hoeflea sp. TaxID=1940281 RepID=UPI0019A2BB9D|nr:EAL domain-containing protein [Hoeflea sp.]MBC7281096.1 EAL domain-containing protein [Hoeflea sp.]
MRLTVTRLHHCNFLRRPSVLAAGIALAVTLAAGIFAENQNRILNDQSARAKVSEQLGLVRAKLEGNINSNIQLVRGLVAVIESQPDIDQPYFSRIAAGLVGNHSQLRNIAGAPDMVVRLMYPLEGNERAIGLDYRTNERQRKAAMEAIETKEMVLTGPVDLVQGGQGFISRFPVFIADGNGQRHAWGIVSAVIDAHRLYAESGLFSADLPLDVSISGDGAAGGALFFGTPAALDNDPVITEVSLPSGNWKLSAVPKGGWSDTPDNVWRIRLVILFGGLLVILPISIAGHLYDQRRVNVRELNRRQIEMEKLSHRLKLALTTSKIGVWEYGLDTSELTWDERMRELYGAPNDGARLGVEYWSLALHPDDREQAEEEFNRAILTGGAYLSEFRVLTGDGTTRWIRAIGATHHDLDGRRYVVGVNWDVSADIELKTGLLASKQNAELRNRELEEARAQMERNSLHDSLTGLPNRRFLDERLLKGHAGRKVTALLHIDLDRFKQINDTLGHAAGDAMLIHAANILKASTRAGDFIARIGGDEFVIATTSQPSEERLSALAGRIIVQMRQPVPYENHECRFGVSIGIAIANADEGEEDCGKRLLIDADIALYRAKSSGRNRFEFFTASLKAEIIRNKRVADDILNGLERKEFRPYFQPQFDARTLDIVGVEALARWDHPTEGILTPDVFLKTAGELNVVPLIDRSILEQTLWQSTRWKAAGLSIPKMSVNVSAGRLYETDLIDSLDGIEIERGTLSFELLESIFLDEKNETIVANIERLRALGIEIEIDDFGTGFASIVSLIQVRPDRLKIDRQLISPIVRSESRRRLVASIIEIGQSLGIKVIAEGVETMNHAVILRDLGCDTLQGYALARPMSSEDLMTFVRDENWRQVA